MAGETAHGVVTHETGTCGKSGLVEPGRPHYRALAEKLLRNLPQSSGSQVEHELLCPVAEIKPMLFAAEIRLPSAFGNSRGQFSALLLDDGAPRGGVVPLHAGEVVFNCLPQLVAGLAAELGFEERRQHEKSIALEPGDLTCSQKLNLPHT